MLEEEWPKDRVLPTNISPSHTQLTLSHHKRKIAPGELRTCAVLAIRKRGSLFAAAPGTASGAGRV